MVKRIKVYGVLALRREGRDEFDFSGIFAIVAAGNGGWSRKGDHQRKKKVSSGVRMLMAVMKGGGRGILRMRMSSSEKSKAREKRKKREERGRGKENEGLVLKSR